MKAWLIRTNNNYIFGPLSKSKIIELYENGSLQPEDEVCSGNGFWFFVKEEELIQKFLMENNEQDFNPVSEAMDVLTSIDIKLDDEDSLASKVENTQVINLNMIENELATDEDIDEGTDKEIDGVSTLTESKANTNVDTEEEIDLDKKKSDQVKTGIFNSTVLNILIFILIIFALSVVYYRKRILKNILTQLSPISTVYAQNKIPVKKKD